MLVFIYIFFFIKINLQINVLGRIIINSFKERRKDGKFFLWDVEELTIDIKGVKVGAMPWLKTCAAHTLYSGSYDKGGTIRLSSYRVFG